MFSNHTGCDVTAKRCDRVAHFRSGSGVGPPDGRIDFASVRCAKRLHVVCQVFKGRLVTCRGLERPLYTEVDSPLVSWPLVEIFPIEIWPQHVAGGAAVWVSAVKKSFRLVL